VEAETRTFPLNSFAKRLFYEPSCRITEGLKWKMNRRWLRAPIAAAPGRSPLPWTTCRGRYRRPRHAAALEKSENNKRGSTSSLGEQTSSEVQQGERHRCCGHRRATTREVVGGVMARCDRRVRGVVPRFYSRWITIIAVAKAMADIGPAQLFPHPISTITRPTP
jgi:hypothetical protein